MLVLTQKHRSSKYNGFSIKKMHTLELRLPWLAHNICISLCQANDTRNTTGAGHMVQLSSRGRIEIPSSFLHQSIGKLLISTPTRLTSLLREIPLMSGVWKENRRKFEN